MAVKKTVVSGIYQSQEQAKQAAAELMEEGFSKDGVTITPSDGGIQLSVHCDTSEQITQAKDLLKETGAQDISSTEETREIFVES
jgi:hypothetical protein